MGISSQEVGPIVFSMKQSAGHGTPMLTFVLPKQGGEYLQCILQLLFLCLGKGGGAQTCNTTISVISSIYPGYYDVSRQILITRLSSSTNVPDVFSRIPVSYHSTHRPQSPFPLLPHKKKNTLLISPNPKPENHTNSPLYTPHP